MEYIKKINISMILLVLTSLRLLLPDANIAMSLFALSLSGLYAYTLYLKSKEVKPLDEEVKKELQALKNTMSGLAVKNGLRAGPTENQKFF